MRRFSPMLVAAVAAVAVAGCQDATPIPTSVLTASERLGGTVENAPSRVVSMMDACDPTTFNAELGEGTCTRNGGVTLAGFLSQL
jgi:hypothetical protein